MSESVWKLLHEEQPKDDDDCFLGFKGRDDFLDVFRGSWGRGAWGEDWKLFGTEKSIFGFVHPITLPVNIYWCYASEFPDQKSARVSLLSLLSQPCDRP